MRRVHELKPGAEFRANRTWYRLIRLWAGSALVEKIGSGKHYEFTATKKSRVAEEGETETEKAEFLGRDRRISIGLSTEVDEERDPTAAPAAPPPRPPRTPTEGRPGQPGRPPARPPAGAGHPPGHRVPCWWLVNGKPHGKEVSSHRRGLCVEHYKLERSQREN